MADQRDNILPSRRGVLLAAGALATGLIDMPGIAAQPPVDDAPLAAFVYEAIVTLGPAEEIGMTPHGQRVRIPITGGTFKGPRISGTIFPEGMDWQLVRADGFTELEAVYLMRETDGTVIQIRNKGIAGKGYAKTTATFEVPNGPHGWLNEAMFAGTVGPVPEMQTPAVRIRMYKLV
ncbi:DUF3237 family protein [Sphingobium sp. HBC34]|uniref:UPF0311 protein Q4610_11255 n=1 Tax=Sphingobium cyanobacteriorum TaxID=3063954 RepID=A0ABT8ZMC6_9SPHN|nr:DUF3237 family protein [Sphingobium sp. HBC34]MDO7835621.1 DUF3237 family protein [Sphingobium sp. HBC34]